jgi:hypothetical protein
LPEAICDTSPLQYLHQLELLHVLPALTEGVIVPPTVVDELAIGRALGISLPDVDELDWISVHSPISAAALPLVTDLGPGETEVLMLALELPETVAVLDDALAHRVAHTLWQAKNPHRTYSSSAYCRTRRADRTASEVKIDGSLHKYGTGRSLPQFSRGAPAKSWTMLGSRVF